MSKLPAIPSVEDEVLGNLRRQPLGVPGGLDQGTVNDLNLPLEFMRRVADRVIQASFRQRHRIVVGDASGEVVRPLGPGSEGPLPAWLSVAPTREQMAVSREWIECRPAVRGFRAAILGGPAWPLEVSSGTRNVAAMVTARLASDGWAKTLDAAKKGLGLSLNSPEHVAKLRAVGVPTDLAGLEPLQKLGFAVSAENGVNRVGAIRAQLTGPGYYAGPGDGGSLDILRQLVGVFPETRFIASTEQRHVQAVLSHMRSWTPAVGTHVLVVPEALPVAQWAQDNTKAGWEETRVQGGTRLPMLLAPRWAGRGEEGGTFIPGETALIDGLPGAGLKIGQSALLFEGGNLMLVQEPSGRRVLLIGEAEVYRNVALGLTRESVIERFKEEFGADICTVLPAASFHIDLEVTVRASADRAMAFVPDVVAAVRTICRLATTRMAERGLMKSGAASSCIGGTLPVILQVLGAAIGERAVGPGQFPLSFAAVFKTGETDSGVGNLQRILYALDWIAAEVTPPNRPPADRHMAAYLRSIRRAEADRRALQRQLRGLGWDVVAVPAVTADEVSLNAINGVHDAARYLMSAYGGLFEPLDREAAAVFEKHLGPAVEVVPILTGETQRRGGGLHCAVCAIPKS